MQTNFRKRLGIFIGFFIFSFCGIEIAFSQGIPGGGQDRQENIYFNSSHFNSKELHYAYGAKVPIWKKESYSHEFSINNRYSNLNNSDIKERFGEDRFYSTSFSWIYKKNRKNKRYFPWTSTLSYGINGNSFLKNSRNNLSFRLMTGHKSKESMHNYGLALSSNGAFKGIPFPFYVYSTKVWDQNLTVGFPFFSISGPRKNETNYQISLSPVGALIKGNQKVNEKITINVSWSYSVDNYLIDNSQFTQRESLLIEKQVIESEGVFKIHKRFSLKLSVGREFGRKYFKGQNIFKKENTRFEMISSNFIKTGVGFVF